MERDEHADQMGSLPTPAEADAALRVAEQTHASMTGIRTPLWYFLALGAWIAPIGPLLSLLPDPPAGVVILVAGLAVWTAALVAIMHLVVRRMRVLVWLSTRQMRPLAVIMLSLLAAFLVLQSVVHPPWGAEGLTVAVGAGIIAFGIHHRLWGR